MATTFKVYFTNYSGFDNNFAFFSDVPIIQYDGQGQVYCNVIASQFVPSDSGDTTFEIDVTQTYYAWTSISPVPTSQLPGTNVVTKISNSKLAQLGVPNSPGSTFKLVNNGGNPTFDPKQTTFEAPTGAFQITADPNAFLPSQNFVCGLGSVDGNGQRIPVATFAAQANTIATITPVVKFYIAQFSGQTGTVIDVSIVSEKAAEIDFTGKGINGAFVKQLPGGGWDITFGTAQAMHALQQNAKLNRSDSYQSELSKLICDLQKKLQNITPASRYLCTFQWVGAPTTAAKQTAVNAVVATMNNGGYSVAAQPAAPNYSPANFAVVSASPVATVRAAWAAAVGNLGAIANTPQTIDANFVNNETSEEL